MAALHVQEESEQGVPKVIVTSKGKSSTGTRATRARRGGDDSVVPLSPTDEPVLVRGNLQKLGKRFKGWHQRYFEIQGTHMYYYKNASKKDCLGEIDLTICYDCEPTSAATFGSPFEIRTVQRSHVLAARSKEEMQQWIQVIKERMSPSESDAKKGGTKKVAKTKRWESFKNTFTINTRQRSQSPAVEAGEAKKTTKKSFIGRFKVRRGAAPTTDAPSKNRPLSFTGADEKRKDTLDVFAQYDVSRSLPASPVLRRKKQSVASVEAATPITPSSLTSGSPFTAGGITSDSQTSTPAHMAASPAHTGGQEIQIKVDVEDTTTVPVIVEPSEERVKGDEGSGDMGEAEKPATPVILVEDQSEVSTKHAEPVEPADVAEKEGEGITGLVEPANEGKGHTESVKKEDEILPTKPADSEPVEPPAVQKEDTESESLPVETEEERPAKPDRLVEKETKDVDIPAEPVAVVPAETGDVESPAKLEKPAEPVCTAEKESDTETPSEPVLKQEAPEPTEPKPEVEPKLKVEPRSEVEPKPEVEPEAQPGLEPHSRDKTPEVIGETAEEQVVEYSTVVKKGAEARSDETPPIESTGTTAKELEKKDDDKPVIPVEPVMVAEQKEPKKPTREKPALPTKPATATAAETSNKPALPVKPATATAAETSNKPALPVKPATVTTATKKANTPTEEKGGPFVPKYLEGRQFQWDKIRETLETAAESTETGSYDELPPMDASTWTDQSSAVEQLRSFLVVCP